MIFVEFALIVGHIAIRGIFLLVCDHITVNATLDLESTESIATIATDFSIFVNSQALNSEFFRIFTAITLDFSFPLLRIIIANLLSVVVDDNLVVLPNF